MPCSTGKNCVDADGATGPLPASCAVCPSIVNSCEGASLIKTTTTENCAAVREVTDCPTQIDGLISTCTSLTTSTGQSAACGKCGVKICNVAGNDYFSSENNICYNGIDTGRIVSGLGCSVSCSDSDASSTDTKGILTVTLGDGRTLTYQDSCDDSFNPSRVKEYYCLNNLAKNVLIGDSNKHCLDGILVPLN
ncbi:hypothetical protein HYU21_03955 [Candidatus Woesearchaeota archaeon]|nr:hypothetical protein [Candidatus Woesearchaeota archaeon]